VRLSYALANKSGLYLQRVVRRGDECTWPCRRIRPRAHVSPIRSREESSPSTTDHRGCDDVCEKDWRSRVIQLTNPCLSVRWSILSLPWLFVFQLQLHTTLFFVLKIWSSHKKNRCSSHSSNISFFFHSVVTLPDSADR
jgi:hypothetical protein